jgi:Fic family protein
MNARVNKPESLLPSDDFSARLGRHCETVAGGEVVRAFLPPPLPPEPPLRLEPLFGLLDRANQALGRLDGMSALLPDTRLFLYFYVRKEAVLSSQIEGTQSSLTDLLLHEGEHPTHVGLDDVEEVSNYVAAIAHGLDRLAEGFPISLRLICEMHAILLRGGRGAGKLPGTFRNSQNWIGGTRPGNAVFVPPPAQEVAPLMGQAEVWLHGRGHELPLLVRAALLHVQFETIHPFLDGNGRLGRLLVTLLLCAEGALGAPVLYLSLYLKTHRERYYDLLTKVRTEGAWEEWLTFFLEGVLEIATQSTEAANRILAIFAEDRRRIEALGRPASTALRVHAAFQARPLTSIARIKAITGLTVPAITRAIEALTALGVVREITGRQRDRLWEYGRYLAVLSEGAEPIRARTGAAGED